MGPFAMELLLVKAWYSEVASAYTETILFWLKALRLKNQKKTARGIRESKLTAPTFVRFFIFKLVSVNCN